MSLKRFFAPETIQAEFAQNTRVEEWDLLDVNELAVTQSTDMTQLGMMVWHQIVTRRLFPVNPTEISPYVSNPMSFRFIESLVGITVIKDLWYCRVKLDDDELIDDVCAEVFVAHTYPNDLILLDVHFKNPYQPIPAAKKRYYYQDYKGLGLFGSLIADLEQLGLTLKCDKILLAAAVRDLVPFFKRYGFNIEKSDAGKLAYQIGQGIPMEKNLAGN